MEQPKMCTAAWGNPEGGVRCILAEGHTGLHRSATGEQALPKCRVTGSKRFREVPKGNRA